MKNKKILFSIIIFSIFFIGFYSGHQLNKPETHDYKEYGGRFLMLKALIKNLLIWMKERVYL